jgi:hypothetical protein
MAHKCKFDEHYYTPIEMSGLYGSRTWVNAPQLLQ